MSSQSVRLREFLQEHLDHLQMDGASGADLDHPEFELYARDYLAFAEKELATRDERSLINCVAHLKRAIDCQVDSFFSICGLARLFEKRNLKFDKKLEFLEAARVFTGRTLSRLNTVRNRMEHSYEIPKVADLEAYCDLAVAFVAVLERTALFLRFHERNFDIAIDDDSYEEREGTKEAKYGFNIRYEFDGPRILVDWNLTTGEVELSADASNIEEFAYFFRIFVLLAQREAFASDKFIRAQL